MVASNGDNQQDSQLSITYEEDENMEDFQAAVMQSGIEELPHQMNNNLCPYTASSSKVHDVNVQGLVSASDTQGSPSSEVRHYASLLKIGIIFFC